jgi:hypothetical protein
MSDLEIVHHLKDSRSPMQQAGIFLAVGLVTFIGAFFVTGFLAWGFKIAGFVAMAIGAAYYFNRNNTEIILTNNSIISKTSAGEKIMLLAEIQKVELSIVENGKMQRKGFFSLEELHTDEKAVLTISDGKNKRIEVAAKNFVLTDFQDFLQTFQANGQGNLLQETDRIKALLQENEKYLATDIQMKKEFEQGLLESYKAIYCQRGEFYLKENPQATILYAYTKNPNNVIYFIDNDFLPNLQAEGLQTAKMLLAGVEKNSKIVDIRIHSYQEITQKLKKMLANNQNKLEMRKTIGKMENLAMKNEMTELKDWDRKELLLQIQTIEELQKITTEMNGQEDLDKAFMLKLQAENLLGEIK